MMMRNRCLCAQILGISTSSVVLSTRNLSTCCVGTQTAFARGLTRPICVALRLVTLPYTHVGESFSTKNWHLRHSMDTYFIGMEFPHQSCRLRRNFVRAAVWAPHPALL